MRLRATCHSGKGHLHQWHVLLQLVAEVQGEQGGGGSVLLRHYSVTSATSDPHAASPLYTQPLLHRSIPCPPAHPPTVPRTPPADAHAHAQAHIHTHTHMCVCARACTRTRARAHTHLSSSSSTSSPLSCCAQPWSFSLASCAREGRGGAVGGWGDGGMGSGGEGARGGAKEGASTSRGGR